MSQPLPPAQPVLPVEYAPARYRRRFPLFRAKHVPLLATLVVCSLLYTAAAIRYPYFASPGVFLNFFRENGPLGIAAIGLTFVILSGGIDLSVGSVMACTGILIATLTQNGMNPWLAMPLALALGAVFGFVMGCLIHFFQLAPFLVTLAGLFFARGVASVISLQSIGLSHPTFVDLSEVTLPITAMLVSALVATVAAYFIYADE